MKKHETGRTEEVIIARHGRQAGVLIGFASDEDSFEHRLEHYPEFLAWAAQLKATRRSSLNDEEDRLAEMWESRQVTIEISKARWAAAETKGRPSTAPAFPQPSEPAMKPPTRQFASCLENAGNEASLILGKVYRVIPDARGAEDGLVRITDESGEDYLFAKEQFAFVELPHAARRKMLALQRAS